MTLTTTQISPSEMTNVVLGDADLDIDTLHRIAERRCAVDISETALGRVERAHRQLLHARSSGVVYGANTGVGANRSVTVRNDERADHGLRLLRSHCAAIGPLEPPEIVRATMAVRLQQILAGGSGVSHSLTKALHTALHEDALPDMHSVGSIGTADLPQLAELALTLIGERPWGHGALPSIPLADAEALPFISSSAATIATTASAAVRLRELLAAAETVAALSFLGLRGAFEAWDPRVHRARPHPHQVAVSERLTALITGPDGNRPTPMRLQDPYGLRTVPQVHAPALHAEHMLRHGIEREINSAAENPLLVPDGVLHHGQFHAATLAANLEHVRITLVPVLTLSAGRLSLLMQPPISGLAAFLADDVAGSSGLMIAEYVAQDALSTARAQASPVTGHSTSISLGLEEHASYATQAARQLTAMLSQGRLIVALEALAAIRALRLAPERRSDCPARHGFELLNDLTNDTLVDRPIGQDVAAIQAAIPALAAIAHN